MIRLNTIMKEVETKVLDIDEGVVRSRLKELGAELVADGRLKVWWYGVPGFGPEDQPWRLRVRTGHGKNEVTWKGKAVTIPGALTRSVEEIELSVDDPEVMGNVFIKIGLFLGAYQEKDRTSWKYKDWHFDLDKYPGVPPFLEIEGQSEEHIKEGMDLLGISGNRTWTTGERRLVEQVYDLDWHQMRFQ